MKRGALAGAFASLLLWASDLAGLARLSFAGVSDAQAQQRVVQATHAAIAGLELRLAALHLLFGLALGALAARGLARRRPAAGGFTLVLLAHALAAGGMLATYPQLYAERLWLAGGWRALLMRAVTAAGPVGFDVALALLVLGLALAAFRRRPRKGEWAVGALATVALASVLIPAPVRVASRSTRPNVLVLAADSLRADRLESREVMPFTSSLAARGTLYRQVFTPLARTFPSWVSALSGSEPRSHGVRTMFPRREDADRVGPTLFGALADAGYRTFAVSDFAGDVFPRFAAGFEELDAPTFTVDSLATATVLGAHAWSLPALRLPGLRALFPEHREMASLSDPQWLARSLFGHLSSRDPRPFAGLVFFSTPHFPYVGPHPYYSRGTDDYDGRFLYHAPPATPGEVSPADAAQVRLRYDGALTAVDDALRRVWDELERSGLASRTLVVVTSDHGEELYDRPDFAGHGDTLSPTALRVPVLLVGPRVAAGRVSDEQGRIIDLPATILDLLGLGERFGDGTTLARAGVERPLCVETGLWFWPTFPRGLHGERMPYAGISELLELDPGTRQLLLRRERQPTVESAKYRGVLLGQRLYTEEPTPSGLRVREQVLAGVAPAHSEVDLAALFQRRCVDGDPALHRLLGLVAWAGDASPRERLTRACPTCALSR